ncbi:hypothetical protein TRFO_20400 [Tritrichomonas foetus]|uniref:Nucleoplasmin-like domain-containing protein n=1 Tax=Tritrichomonas foetus TaxID=1144522 RepID=A0A1J4KH36_9EUKA|nr:hypothetical protein TRFO_20400 [Tritrichomonas foetus]|eukprot:OHT10354.1 hypothetical protein TRFO_20400 [Tritrichomonas foetus]
MCFNQRNWTLELEPDVPAILPIPNGCPCIINGVYATDTSAQKIVLEAKIQIIRIDRIDEESDIAQTEVVSPILATVFPQINPSLSVHIEFSQFNVVSVRATGGKLVLNGIYDAGEKIPELDIA